MKVDNSLARHWLIVVILSTLIFFALTMVIGAQQSVWFDESYSVLLARSSWRDLFHLTAVDAHPPLYYLLLKLWGGIGNFNDLWLRFFSALSAAGAIFFSLLLARKSFGSKVAILAAPLLALSPFLMRYGFEIRMYALAALIAVAATYVLIKATESNRRKHWVIYGILVAIGMLTLNYMIFVFAAHAAWLVYVWAKQKPRAKLWREPWLKAYILAIICYLPWLPFAANQLIHDVSSGIATTIGPVEIVKILSFTFVYQPEYWLDKWTGFLLIIVTIIAIFLITRALKLATKPQKQSLILLLSLSISPILIMIFLGLVSSRGLFVERYIAHFIWAFYLVIGVTAGIVLIKSKKTAVNIALYLVLVGTLILGVVNLYHHGNFNFQRMQTNAAKEIVATMGGCRADRPIVVDDIYEYIELQHYLRGCDNLFFYTDGDMPTRGGYAPLEHSSARLTAQNLDTQNLIVIRIKDQAHFRAPSEFRLISTEETFDVIGIETYTKD